MKNADSRHNWNSFATGYLRTHWALAVVQRAWVICLLALATAIVGFDEALGQNLPPSVTIQPPSRSVTVGHPATFRADFKGSGPLGFKWAFGTNDIPGANSSRYVIYNVQPTNAGTFRVFVTNAFGSASASAELTVTPPGPLDIWTPVNSGTTNYLSAVAMNHHTIVAVGESGTIVTSTNGLEWITQISGVTNDLYTVLYANGLFVAGGDSGTIVTSADGKVWTSQRTPTTDTIYGLAFGNGAFVAVGGNGLILTTPDAAHWTYHQFFGDGSPVDFYCIAFGNGIFVTATSNPDLLFYSSLNGSDWVSNELLPPDVTWWRLYNVPDSLIFDNGYFYCVGGNSFGPVGLHFLLISDNGGKWWGGYFDLGGFPAAVVIGSGSVLVTVTSSGTGSSDISSGIGTADIGSLNADRPIWNDPNTNNDPEFYPIDYLTFRKKVPVFLSSLGFWHSRFVAVGDAGAIYLSGTLPPYLSQIAQSGDATIVSVEGIPLESYVLQSAPTIIGPWQSVSTNSTSADGIVTFTDPTPPDGGSRFYRVSGP